MARTAEVKYSKRSKHRTMLRRYNNVNSIHNRKKRLVFFGTLMVLGQLAFFLVELPQTNYLVRGNYHRQLLELNSNHINQYPFTNFLDVKDQLPPSEENNKTVGYYWQVPRCGGTTMKHIMGSCLRLVQAARTSSDYCDMNTLELQTCQTKVGRFVNADPSDHKGIQRANKMKLVQSGIPDVVISSRIFHAATLFDDEHRGRIFTILRDPIERSVSTFYYLQNAYWERHYRPDLKEMTLLDYAALPETANNWMTRWLTGKNSEPVLTQQDVEFAKELLERKFLVMLTNKMSASIEMLMYYMGWERTVYRISKDNYNSMRECLIANTKSDTSHWNKNQHLMPDLGTPEYEALYAINEFDMQLFEHAKKVFEKQAEMFSKVRKKKVRNLFRGSIIQVTNEEEELVNATKRSDYEAAQVAANLMERPPEEASVKSLEATNSLVATALMIINPNATVPLKKIREEKDMIASTLARQRQDSTKWAGTGNKKMPLHLQSFTLIDENEQEEEEEEDEHLLERLSESSSLFSNVQSTVMHFVNNKKATLDNKDVVDSREEEPVVTEAPSSQLTNATIENEKDMEKLLEQEEKDLAYVADLLGSLQSELPVDNIEPPLAAN